MKIHLSTQLVLCAFVTLIDNTNVFSSYYSNMYYVDCNYLYLIIWKKNIYTHSNIRDAEKTGGCKNDVAVTPFFRMLIYWVSRDLYTWFCTSHVVSIVFWDHVDIIYKRMLLQHPTNEIIFLSFFFHLLFTFTNIFFSY